MSEQEQKARQIELHESEWYKTRPAIIKEALRLWPADRLYRFINSKKHCYIISYEEPSSGRLQDLTVTVQKIGHGGHLAAVGLGHIDTNQVFGVSPKDLELVPDDELDEDEDDDDN